MDALEFIKTAQRYTKSEGYDTFVIAKFESPEEILERIERWAEEHPIRTRQSELLKLFPNAKTLDSGALCLCPKEMTGDSGTCSSRKLCDECCEQFWLEEVDNGRT